MALLAQVASPKVVNVADNGQATDSGHTGGKFFSKLPRIAHWGIGKRLLDKRKEKLFTPVPETIVGKMTEKGHRAPALVGSFGDYQDEA